jgi:hypothetical protein
MMIFQRLTDKTVMKLLNVLHKDETENHSDFGEF